MTDPARLAVAVRARIVSSLLRVYKFVLSPALHAAAGTAGACRFQPSCSEYAAIAVAECGVFRGGAMAAMRLLRCHPLHRGGFDPVPAKQERTGRTAESARLV